MTGERTAVDGRTARRDRNRELVLDTVLELFGEGRLVPAAPEVAERSGVSLRSVFRYYEDTEALLRAAMARHVERVEPLFEVPEPGVGAFEDRVARLVAARLRLYRAVAPTVRASLVRAPTSPLIAAQLDRARRRLRAQTEEMFGPELTALSPARRRTALVAADALLQFESVEHVCERSGLTDRQATEVLRHGLRAVLGPDGASSSPT